MEKSNISDYTLPTVKRRRARANPDVPEDIAVALLHLNDPNWTFDDDFDRASFDAASFTTDEEQRTPPPKFSSFEMPRSSKLSRGGSSIDYASEFQSDEALRYGSQEAVDFEDDSPYAEVRAAVPNTDDPEMPVNTFRVWVIGLIATLVIAGLNMLFGLRYPSVAISGLVAQLATLPIGKLFARVLPTKRFSTFGYVWSFNPGPFNVKEHTLITVMCSIGASGAYATDVIAAQRYHFGQTWSTGYQLLLCLSSQMIGYAFAGIMRRFLVWPSSMVYPGVLVNCALFNTLHSNFNHNAGLGSGTGTPRQKVFLLAFIGSFVWYFMPGYLFTALSVFNWVCWIAPSNVKVNQLFGYSTGLGMGFLTFDWAMISYIGSPLVIPWWAQVNTIAAFAFFMWFLAPILYYKNVWDSAYLPISIASTFDNTGSSYNISSVLTDGIFDEDLYKAYSPLFLPITYALAYGITFASLSSVIVHTWLWYRRDIFIQFRKSLKDNRDVHSRLMTRYREAPHWWYIIMYFVFFGMAIGCVRGWDTKLPVWGLIVSLLISVILIIPAGIIRALTNEVISGQVLGEFVVGYILPGRPVAMMIFKTFSYTTMNQAVTFSQDLKLGHYMKIPPRLMFWAQVIATFEAVVVVVFVQQWMFSNIPDLCTEHQAHFFTCPSTSAFASAAIIWGGIGPERIFSHGATYYPIIWFFLIGAILPIPLYYIARAKPLSLWRYVNIPVMLSGVSVMPPATGINFSSFFLFGAFFQFFMRRFHQRWWKRYNYILSAAFDAGLAVSLIVIFFALQLPKGGISLNWWGNTVYTDTADYEGVTYLTLAPGTTFGPSSWS